MMTPPSWHLAPKILKQPGYSTGATLARLTRYLGILANCNRLYCFCSTAQVREIRDPSASYQIRQHTQRSLLRPPGGKGSEIFSASDSASLLTGSSLRGILLIVGSSVAVSWLRSVDDEQILAVALAVAEWTRFSTEASATNVSNSACEASSTVAIRDKDSTSARKNSSRG